MKKNYVKPVFVAEAYTFTESIANCVNNPVGPYKALMLVAGDGTGNNKGTNLCEVGDSGHGYIYVGDAYQKYGLDRTTLFNDGSGIDWDKDVPPTETDGVLYYSGCDFDWGGTYNNVVTGPDGKVVNNFARSFYDDNTSHKPGYEGHAFSS